MRKIKAQKITAENFKPYGTFSDILNPSGYSLGNFYADRLLEPAKTALPLAFSSLTVHKKNAMVIDTVEYHNYTGEILMPLDTDVVIHVAPPSKTLIPEKTPFSIEKEKGSVLIVLPERTYLNDCTVFKYDEKDQIEITL